MKDKRKYTKPLINKGWFRKGQKNKHPLKKGTHNSPKTEFTKGKISNEKHPNWKGDGVSYAGLHIWINKKLGKPKHCAYCGRNDDRMYHWANISKSYKRELSDWIRLCVPCHSRFDRGEIQLK